MLAQNTAVWAGATCAAVAVAGAAALYVVHPSFLWPTPVPTVAKADAPPTAKVVPSSSPPAAARPAASAAIAAGASAAATNEVKPAFDVVNVEPTGEAVIAGRAAPNVKVELRDAGKTLAEATTDNAGQFVIIPPTLPPGAHSLMLATEASTPPETSSAIAVVVPEPPPTAFVAARTPSSTAAAVATPSTSPAPARIVVQSVEASAGGRLVARGVAEPNATVRLYLSGAFVGDAKTKADGRWSLTIKQGLTPGDYAVRADEIDPQDAAVIARAEAPFDYATSSPKPGPAGTLVADAGPASAADVIVESVQTHHVEPGHTLWGISQKFYGDGSRYELIFAANANQIKNPNLIYPGQMFVVPRPEPKP